MLGRLNRVYEILNRTRPLTLKMIWQLHKGLGIPAESLIKQPEERRAAWRYLPVLAFTCPGYRFG